MGIGTAQRAGIRLMKSSRMAPAIAPVRAPGDCLFLPDFCSVRMVFGVVVVAQLLAFVLVLAPAAETGERWSRLSLLSLFVQWVALSTAGVLCVSRPWLSRLSDRSAGLASYAMSLVVMGVLSEAAFRLSRHTDLGLALPAGAHLGFLARNLMVSAIINAVVLRYFYVQHQWQRNVEAEARARVQALQARIRPHFLFNSMNTIAALTRLRPELAEEVVEDLADLFRATLADDRALGTVEDELELARRYLHIEKLRLGERLTVDWDLKEVPGGALLPAFTLQPLLENAVYHGIEPLPEGGTVQITGRSEQGRVVLTVSNPVAPGTHQLHQEGNRMAQDNIRQRLELAFPGRGGLQVAQAAGRYRVEVQFPASDAVQLP